MIRGINTVRQLTTLQSNVLAFIEGYVEGHTADRPPTHREILTGLEIKNSGTLTRALDSLESKRFILRRQGSWRNIVVLRSYI